jgi:glycosyltransferase involved in cell wall biosynthesis
MFDTSTFRLPGGRLRIVHCVRAPIGGIFRNVLDLAAEQSARGHLVGIVLDSTTGGAFEAKKIADAAQHLALGVTRLPMSRSIKPSDIVSAWNVYRVVRGLAPDVMHGHGAKGGTFARLAGTLLSTARKPVARIYSPHGGTLHFDRGSLAGRLVFGIERLLERTCDAIVHVSRYEAEAYLDKIGKASCRVSVIVNGLRSEEFTEIVPAEGAKDIVYMGMLRDLKGPTF